MNKISIALACGLVVVLTGCELDRSMQPSENFDSQKSSILNSINNKLAAAQTEYYCLERGKEPSSIDNNEKIYIYNPIDRSILNNLPESDENIYQRIPNLQNSSNNYFIPVKKNEINPNTNITYYRKISSPLIVCGQFIQNSEKQAQRVRNDLINEAISYINTNYQSYINDLHIVRTSGKVGSDIFEKLVQGTAAVINPATSVTTGLTIGLSTFQSARVSIESNFFSNIDNQTFINQMDANRREILKSISENRKSNTSDYPLSAAIIDLVDYYNAGTLVRAMINLSQETARRAAGIEPRSTIPSVNSEVLIVPIKTDTFIKKSTVDSTKLNEADKFFQRAGSYLEIKSYVPAANANNYWKIQLVEPKNGTTEWFIYKPHADTPLLKKGSS
jgi:hypothetical protein